MWTVVRRHMELGIEMAGGYGGGAGGARGRDEGKQDLPRRLVRLALEARARDLVSPLRMARLLQVNLSTAEELYSYFISAEEGAET